MTKQVRYDGEDTRELPTLGFTVSGGDVIEVPDDFDVFNFSPVDSKKAKIDVPPAKTLEDTNSQSPSDGTKEN